MTNYVNPESFYPLQTGVAGEAFGSGTVPGSIYAGMMLPERMQDYRNVRDTSLQSSRLANLAKKAEYEDYLAAGPSRTSGYDVTTGANRNTLASQPLEHKIKTGRLVGEYDRLPQEETFKKKTAESAVSGQQRASHLLNLASLITALQPYKDEKGNIARPDLAAQELQRQGFEVNPQYIPAILELDPEKIKNDAAYALEKYKQDQTTTRGRDQNATTLEAARIGASAKSTAEIKESNLVKLTDEYTDIMEVVKSGGKLTPRQAARKAAIEMRMREATYQQEAIGDREAEVPARKIAELEGAREKQKFIKEKFSKDKNMKGFELGPYDPDSEGFEVIDPKTGETVGDYY